MKCLILSIIVVLISTLNSTKLSFKEEWEIFKLTHNKKYTNPLEEIRRMAIFRQNLASIEMHNRKYEKNLKTYSKKINQFGDWTKEEFINFLNRGKKMPELDAKFRLKWTPIETNETSIDWRTKNIVTAVKDQGACGSCWSFSTTGALEGQLALKGKGLISLSEQNLMDCSLSYGNDGCDGGWMDNAFEYIKDHGIMSEENYPYEGHNRLCKFNESLSVTSISGYLDVPIDDESILKNALASNGPIAVAIDASDELQFYFKGILNDHTCSSTELNHGVLLVGYGSENGTDFWIVKNSWGKSWGEDGYYRAVRNVENNCGITKSASFPIL